MGYEAVVFDNDGVLTVPTETARYERAVETAFAAFDVEPDPEHVAAMREDLSPETVREIARHYGVDAAAFWRRHEVEGAAAQHVALREGEKALYDDVTHLEDLDVPLGIVSNNQHRTVEHIVEECDLAGVFDTYYGRHPTLSGMATRKPDPSYIEDAMADLGTREVLYVGDSNVDVAAADAAGIDSAYVERPHRSEEYLRADPTHTLSGLDDLPALVAGKREKPA